MYTIPDFKVSFLILGLLFCSAAKGQTKLTTKYFESTVWSSDNRDSMFFKSDTIKLVKTLHAVHGRISDSLNIAGYFKENDFVTLEFNRKNILNLFVTNTNTWSIIKKNGFYAWFFNYKKQNLRLYFKNKIFASFKPLNNSEVRIQSIYVGHPVTKTVEITMIRNR